MTATITVVLTIFAIRTKTDFTTHDVFCPILFASLLCLFICYLFMAFSSWWHPVVAAILVIVYGLYIVHDTQLITGDKKYSLSYDDYIVGALIVYIDIVMLFLELLRLLGK